MRASSNPLPSHRSFLPSASAGLIGLAIALATLATSCRDTGPAPPKHIAYTQDGRTVKAGDPRPIIIDLNSDTVADFTVFVELTANATGDHLYAGINPIGPHQIKSDPPDDNRFLNMGLLVSEITDAEINETLQPDTRWTDDHGTLVIRHTPSTGPVWYEGAWSTDAAELVGIQLVIGGKTYFGWLRLRFDKSTEVVTLVEYAWEQNPWAPIRAGEY